MGGLLHLVQHKGRCLDGWASQARVRYQMLQDNINNETTKTTVEHGSGPSTGRVVLSWVGSQNFRVESGPVSVKNVWLELVLNEHV